MDFQQACKSTLSTFIHCDHLLFEEVPIDFKLLFEHDLSPIFNDEGVWFQVLGSSEDFPVFLHPRYPPQLELQTAHHKIFVCK